MKNRFFSLFVFLTLLTSVAAHASANNNGTLVGSPNFVAGKFGQAASLNGTSQYVTAPDPGFLGSGSWTEEGWFQTTTTSSVCIAALANPGGSVGNWYVTITNGKVGLGFTGATSSVTDVTTTAADGNWHHWALVYVPGMAKVYVDGVQVIHAPGTYAPASGCTKYLGVYAGAAGTYLPGLLDEFRSSVGARYNAAFTPPAAAFTDDASTVALYHLDGNANDSHVPALATGTITASATTTSSITPQLGTITGGTAPYSTVFSYGTATNGTYSQIGTAVAGASPVASAAATGLSAATTYYFRAVTTDSEGTPVSITSPSATTGTPLATGAPVVTVPVTDPNLFFSPYNWYSDGAGALAASNVKAASTVAVTNNPGAYLKAAFTGTSFALNVDTTPLSGAGTAAGNYPVLRYSVDNASWVTIQLASGVTTPISLSGLSAGTHTIYIIYWQSAPTLDRWTTTPLPVDVVKITGVTLASGAATVSLAGTPLSIKPKNLLAYGDSITEGLNITGTVAPTNADALASYVALVADGLGAEIGVVGFGGLGWQWTGGGNVVPLYTPGNDTGSSWNKYFAGQSRLVSGLLSPAPDYVTVAHGTNDGLNSVADATVTASVSGWIAAVRAAAPTSPLFVLMPFGQFKVSAIQAGVTAAADPRTYVVNLGTNFSTGLTSFSLGANARSNDGIHPPAYIHARAAAGVVSGMQTALSPGGLPFFW